MKIIGTLFLIGLTFFKISFYEYLFSEKKFGRDVRSQKSGWTVAETETEVGPNPWKRQPLT